MLARLRRDGPSAIILSGMLIQQSFAFLQGIIVAHAIGAGGYGTTNILRNMLTAGLTLAPIGLDLALLKYGPRFPDHASFVAQTRRLRLVVAAANITVLLIVWGLLGGWLEHVVYRIPGFRGWLFITLIGLPIAADLAVMNSVYRVENRPARYALMSTWLQPPIRVIGGVLALTLHWGVTAIVCVNTLAYAVSAVSVAIERLVSRSRDPLPAARIAGQVEADTAAGPQAPAVDMTAWSYLGTIMRDSVWMALSLFAYGALRFVDVLVLGAFQPTRVVGSYAALSVISQLVAFYPMAMSQTLGPNISRHYHAGDLQGVHRVLNDYMWTASIAGGFIFGGVAAFGDHLDLVFGHSFAFDPRLALLLPLGWFVSATLAPTGYSLSMTGHHKAELGVLATGTCVLIAGCFLLVPLWGAIGAATAVLITFLVIDLSRFAMVARHLGFWPGKFGDLLPPALAAAAAYAVRLLSDATLGRSFPVLVAGCVVYAAVFAGAMLVLHRRCKRADRAAA